MVFKRVLKGIGRLMLTTAVMCGVGLFLCSSEVKAEVKVILEAGNDINGNPGGFTVTVTAAQNDDISKITKIELMDDSSASLYSLTTETAVDTTSGDTSDKFQIKSSEFLEKIDKTSINSDGTEIKIKNAKVTYEKKPVSGSGAQTTQDSSALDPVITKTIYKISAPALDNSQYETDLSSSSPSYTITATYVEGVVGYGYKDEEYSIKSSATDYYANYHTGSASEWTEEGEFKDATTPYSGTLGTNPIPTKVQYFPKFNNVWFETTGSTNVYLDDNGRATYNSLKAIFDNNNLNNSSGKDRNIIMSNMVIVPELTNTGSTNIAGYTWSSGGGTPSTTIYFGTSTTHALSDINSPGIAKVKAIARKSNGGNVETPPINSVETTSSDNYLSLNVYAQPTGILLQNVPISVMAGGNATTVKIFNGIEPSGANQSLSSYKASLSVSQPGVIDVTDASFNSSTGEITVKASSTATSGATATVTLTLKDSFNNTISKTFDVKIISFDKDKTISSINKSNKNYITYNKDKGYSLDIKQLIIDNAKDTSDNAVTITKDQITDVYVGGLPCSDGIWKPSEAALNKKVTCKINRTAISSDSFTVSAYPMPTATYSSSNRTLSVKIPTKVATSYSDDNNIRQSKGFKLILEDSSGNTLYEYTDSKYQSVLSSSSESTVTYTVPAADIEGMVTSAASNGKFSADTTSVKFKVIPMGYKQSSTSDETIKAKDEIAGKTDAVTVYKVSASGTNFTSSAAYGLDGQTVSITATPNSGYSFKQWSDGNTSNPRQVKVSASGTRAFQAVAGDRVANSTGAGGTDNSELYDDVPKTAESNSAIWLIVFMVFAVMGTTYALYLQLRAANSKHDR